MRSQFLHKDEGPDEDVGKDGLLRVVVPVPRVRISRFRYFLNVKSQDRDFLRMRRNTKDCVKDCVLDQLTHQV